MLTKSQQEAKQQIVDWLGSKGQGNIFRLSGYAGTGKSYLINELEDDCHDFYNIFRVAYTGKACHVMREMGMKNVSTIHSLIYNTYYDRDSEEFIHKLKDSMKGAMNSLIIVDEASMVPQHMQDELEEMFVDCHILYVGDSGQLPPVNSLGGAVDTPNVELSEIVRQADTNPIVDVADMVRRGQSIKSDKCYTKCVNGETLGVSVGRTELFKSDLQASVRNQFHDSPILVLANKDRASINNKIVDLYEYCENYMVLANDKTERVFNGMVVKPYRDFTVPKHPCITHLEICDPDAVDGHRQITVNTANIGRSTYLNPDLLRRELGANPSAIIPPSIDYGYAMTVHKAQGSTVDVAYIARAGYEKNIDIYSRWMYTALTRASKRVHVISIDSLKKELQLIKGGNEPRR